jgi:hypothetical protein
MRRHRMMLELRNGSKREVKRRTGGKYLCSRESWAKMKKPDASNVNCVRVQKLIRAYISTARVGTPHRPILADPNSTKHD